MHMGEYVWWVSLELADTEVQYSLKKIFAVLCCSTLVLWQFGFNFVVENLTKNPAHCVGPWNYAAPLGDDKNEVFYEFGRSVWLYVGRILGRLKNWSHILNTLLSSEVCFLLFGKDEIKSVSFFLLYTLLVFGVALILQWCHTR